MRTLLAASLGLAIAAAAPLPTFAAQMPATWDGLSMVSNSGNGTLYLLPGANFRNYTKVMIDPTEVAFKKGWEREQPKGVHVRSADVSRIREEAGTKFGQSLSKALQKQGYVVVQEPGDDVLRVRAAVLNLSFVVPNESSGRNRTYARQSGHAVLAVEARDSVSDALLGRVMDGAVAGDDMTFLTDRQRLWSDFEIVFDDWTKRVAAGLTRLRSASASG